MAVLSVPIQSNEAQTLYEQAIKLCHAGKNPEALDAIGKAVALQPNNDQYLAYMSNVERIAAHYAEGLSHAKRAIELNPNVVWYWGQAAINADGALNIEDAVKYSKFVIANGDKKEDKFYIDSALEILDTCEDAAAIPQQDRAAAQQKLTRYLGKKGFIVQWDPIGKTRVLDTFKTTGPRPEGIQIALPLIVQGLEWVPEGFIAKDQLHITLSGKLSTAAYEDCGGASSNNPMSFGMNVEHFHSRKFIGGFCSQELFHIMECYMDYRTIDRQWETLNEPCFTYIGYENVAKADPHRKGFATPYSQVKGSEDRADLFMCLLSDPDRMKVQASTDQYLAKKIGYLKKFTSAALPLIDDRFWQRAQKGEFKMDTRMSSEK